MDFLKKNFEKLRESGFRKILEALERTFKKFGVDHYIIGATARDLWTNHLPLLRRRITMDIDFTFYVAEYEQFDKIKQALVSIENFTADSKQPYRLYKNEMIIDLIPFGAIEKD